MLRMPWSCFTQQKEQLIKLAVPAEHESALTFPRSVGSVVTTQRADTQSKAKCDTWRDFFYHVRFLLELQITLKACQAIRNLPELLGSGYMAADSAPPTSGADKGHGACHCIIRSFQNHARASGGAGDDLVCGMVSCDSQLMTPNCV